MINYESLCESLRALVDGVPHKTANLANASALLYHSLDRLNWAGFYLMEDGKLVLNAFQGKPACIEISVGRGVCGTAVFEKQTLVVPDVHKFEGHIACDGASESEIVIPLFKNGTVVGVLDIDSPFVGRFDETDEAYLLELVRLIEARCDFSHTGYTF